MSIDYDLTAGKEIRNHAELYRILKNVQRSELPKLRGWGWDPYEVLIEATILDSKAISIGEADLLLTAENPDKKEVPLLVIEVKKHVIASLTKPFQNGFRQAWKYAQPIGCKFCAVYDGHFMVTMQRSHPYLIGLCEFPINSNHYQKIEFAKRLCESLLILRGDEASEPVDELCSVVNYPRWKGPIRYLIRDAYRRFYNNTNPSEEDVERIAQIWDERNR